MSTCEEDGLAPAATPFQAAWMALRDAVNAEFDEYERNAGARFRREISIAKALWREKNPHCDDLGMNHPVMDMLEPMRDNGGVCIRGPIVPSWAMYLREARRALDAVSLVPG